MGWVGNVWGHFSLATAQTLALQCLQSSQNGGATGAYRHTPNLDLDTT